MAILRRETMKRMSIIMLLLVFGWAVDSTFLPALSVAATQQATFAVG